MQSKRLSRVPSPLAAAIAAISLCGTVPVHAFQFELADGEVTGSFDTTLSYGALWRVTGRDSANVALANGGSKSSANYDDGNLNYDRGDLVSSLFKMTNDLDLNYRNFGAFLRINSFYDHSIQNKDFRTVPGLAPGVSYSRGNERVLRNRLGHDYEILDAYVRGRFNVVGRALDVRAGKQVVSWGESTFIPNGLNVINPVDVAKLRAPGAELKEAFLPVNMLWLSQEITDNLTVEAFHQFQYRKTRLEPAGSYFSTNDFISPGGGPVIAGSGTVNEGVASTVNAFIPRDPDNDPKNSGQFGVAARLLTPRLNNTEFGLFFAQYHSRTPQISGTALAPPPAVLSPGSPDVSTLRYNTDYAEKIRMYGLSFNTPGPMGVALQGEYSYRPNQPVQMVATDLLIELLSAGCLETAADVPPLGNCLANPYGPNAKAQGYKRVKYHQLQMTGSKAFGPMMGSDQVVVVAEAGYVYQKLPKGVAFNGPGVDFGVSPTAALLLGTTQQQGGLATNNSYGYRAVARADYNNALGPINLSPRIAWSHDLRGTSQTFVQGVKAASVGLAASYQQNWQADISYTNFFGGESFEGLAGGRFNSANPPASIPPSIPVRSTNNALSDRDFIAATISYSF